MQSNTYHDPSIIQKENPGIAADIAIIGGGFSGTATCIQLIRQAAQPIRITLINDRYPLSRGIAYSSFSDNHLLNVPAGKMSLFPDDPDHFCNWIKSRDEYVQNSGENLHSLYLPRNIYGAYLNDLKERFITQASGIAEVKMIHDEVIDIRIQGNRPQLIFRNREPLTAKNIMLATGNELPANPAIQNKSFYSEASPCYFRNPWSKDSVSNLEGIEKILIIGTGLTMVDNVCSLMDNGFQGKIVAVSTKGLLPLSHKKTIPYSAILDEVNEHMSLVDIYRVFKSHIRKVMAEGHSGEIVVDAIRPMTQKIWQNLSAAERQSFMRHLRHLWGLARHRLPAEIHEKISSYRKNGTLEIVAGRLVDLELQDRNQIRAGIRLYKKKEIRFDHAGRVINCTGPQMDIQRFNRPLIQNLLKNRMIEPDKMKLGIHSMPDGTILNTHQDHPAFLYTLGSNLRGTLWETTAVPELRQQASNMAGMLLSKLKE